MANNQRTLKNEYKFIGKGLHSGLGVTTILKPAPVNTGIRFHRKDLGENAIIEALVDYVTYTQRSTTLEKDNIKIVTLEHLMATFYALGVDNALVEIDTFYPRRKCPPLYQCHLCRRSTGTRCSEKILQPQREHLLHRP